ncbi:MAG: hypothetical protein AABW81_02885 [Nanoarchaeota archaeon]
MSEKEVKISRSCLAFFQIFLVITSVISFSVIVSAAFEGTNQRAPSATYIPPSPSILVDSSKNIFYGGKLYKGEIIENNGIHYANINNNIVKFENNQWVSVAKENIPIDLTIKAATPQSSHLGGFIQVAQGGYYDAILTGAKWAIGVYFAVSMLAKALGEDEEQAKAWGAAAAAGMFTGQSLNVLLGENGALSSATNGWNKFFTLNGKLNAGQASFGWGLAVAAIVFYMTYKKESSKIISFECNPWDATTGGKYCEECNKQGILPCSEYQCRSLGQSCQLLNPGTGEEKCTWVNRKDVTPPIISTWKDALLDDFKYGKDNTVFPPDRGEKIIYSKTSKGCVKAFMPFSFGITTDEPSKCKLDPIKKQNFSDMRFYFGGSSLFRYNHTQVMSLPGPNALAAENLTLENNGNFELFIRCSDANGNSNTANFVFKYCVEDGPDTTPPLIVSTSLLNGMPVAYNQSSVKMDVYINEPAECKWSPLDRSYKDMEETMSCSSQVSEMNAQMLYKCTTTLTGIKDRQESKFYFRCKDNPGAEEGERNVNTQSYIFTLLGTQPLVIDSVGPNGTIKDSTDTVKITLTAKTSAGYKDGEAACYFSESGDEDTYTLFYNTNSHTHSQDLYLVSGTYNYFIKCLDLGGNTDIKEVNFKVESDRSSPSVARVYFEDNNLKIVTTEKGECVYDTKNCNYQFKDGIAMTDDEEMHYTSWNTGTIFYIKCQDEFENQPLPNACTIIVRPSDIYSEVSS